jgi:hypothetical protein
VNEVQPSRHNGAARNQCCSFFGLGLPLLAVKNIFKIDLGGKWYVRVLKVCIAIVGAWLLVAILFFLFGFVKALVLS